MRSLPTFFLVIVCITVCVTIPGFSQTVLIDKIEITGNRVTRDAYIRSFLTFDEGIPYELDSLLNEINRSKEKLNKTGLFENVFFNDTITAEHVPPDDRMLIDLLIQVTEKNYFLFGPAGYLGIEGDFYAKTAVYADYRNLFGDGSQVHVSVPFYEDIGLSIEHSGRSGNLRYALGFDYVDDAYFQTASNRFSAGFGYRKSRFEPGVEFQLQSADLFTTLFCPYIEVGDDERPYDRRRTWYSVRIHPFYGWNSGASNFYGIMNSVGLYHDIFLKIIYSVRVQASVGTGEFPVQYLFYSTVRGTQPQSYSDTYRLSMNNEFQIPWPSNNRIIFVPFLDMNYLDDTFLIGGGIGLHLYTKYQDPLVLEVGYGRGFMLNFSIRRAHTYPYIDSYE